MVRRYFRPGSRWVRLALRPCAGQRVFRRWFYTERFDLDRDAAHHAPSEAQPLGSMCASEWEKFRYGAC